MRRGLRSFVEAAIIPALSALLAACSGGAKQLSPTDIQLAAGDLRTFSASAKMLIEQCSAQNATETFCREQADLLASKVEDGVSALDGQGGDAEPDRQRLQQNGIQLKNIVDRVQQSSSSPGDAEAAQTIAAVAKQVEDKLRQ
jgi:hypothetical protein